MCDRRGLLEHFGIGAEDRGEGTDVGADFHALARGGNRQLTVEVFHAVDPAHGDHPLNIFWASALPFEVGGIGRQQGDEMTARRVSGDENLFPIAAVPADVLAGPGEGAGHVLDVLRVRHAWRKTVIGQHHDQPSSGETAGNGAVAVDAEHIVLAADHPTAAVDEEKHRPIGLPFRTEDIELMAIPIRVVGDFMVGDVPKCLHLAGLAGGGGFGRPSSVGSARGQKRKARYGRAQGVEHGSLLPANEPDFDEPFHYEESPPSMTCFLESLTEAQSYGQPRLRRLSLSAPEDNGNPDRSATSGVTVALAG
jgi:hypothetical protein